jgi:hypothetical protein
VLSRGKSIFFGSWLELLQFTPPDSSAASVISSIVSSLQVDKMSDDHLEGDEEGTQRPRYESDKLSKELGRLMTGKSVNPYFQSVIFMLTHPLPHTNI